MISLLALLSSFAFADSKELKDIKAKIELIDGPPLIEWEKKEFDLKLDDSSIPVVYIITLTGKSRDPKSAYTTEQRGIPIKVVDGRLTVTIAAETRELDIIEVAESGKVDKNKYKITITDWPSAEVILKTAQENQINKPWFFGVGVGVSAITYSQTNMDFGTLNSVTPTVKLMVDRRLGEKGYVAGFTGFINTPPSSGNATGNNAFKFLGLNLKIGKIFKNLLPEPWEIGAHVGYYYLTMLTDGTLGFNNVYGPEIYPTITKKFNNGSQATAYFKFSAISQRVLLLSLSNNEIAAGAQYRFAKKSKIQWLTGFDFATVNLATVDTQLLNTLVKTSSMTLWVGVSF